MKKSSTTSWTASDTTSSKNSNSTSRPPSPTKPKVRLTRPSQRDPSPPQHIPRATKSQPKGQGQPRDVPHRKNENLEVPLIKAHNQLPLPGEQLRELQLQPNVRQNEQRTRNVETGDHVFGHEHSPDREAGAVHQVGGCQGGNQETEQKGTEHAGYF